MSAVAFEVVADAEAAARAAAALLVAAVDADGSIVLAGGARRSHGLALPPDALAGRA